MKVISHLVYECLKSTDIAVVFLLKCNSSLLFEKINPINDVFDNSNHVIYVVVTVLLAKHYTDVSRSKVIPSKIGMKSFVGINF